MVSLGIMLTVIVVGALIIAMSTNLDTNTPPSDPPIIHSQTLDVFWGESQQTDVYDIHMQASTALTIAEVKDLDTYIEPDANSITYRNPVELEWAREGDVIHLYDYDDDLEEHQGEFLYVEGTLLDDRAVERPFSLHRYLVPQGWSIDLRISPLGITIDTSNLTDGMVSIEFQVENRGTLNVSNTLVEVFSVHPAFKASGFPSYGSPYLWEIFNTTVSVPTNGSKVITCQVPVKDLFRRGVMVVVDPDNAMPGTLAENSMATEELPEDVTEFNKPGEADTEGGSGLNLGFVAIMVAAIIIVVLVIVALLVLKNE
jgi:hypothetical protein